jgi:hypothetical protein
MAFVWDGKPLLVSFLDTGKEKRLRLQAIQAA